MSSDTILLFIRDCRVNLNIGLYDAELQRTQPVVINIECEASLTRRYDDISEKDITQVINYRPLYQYLREELIQMGHIYLLESAAEKIADFCFRDSRVKTARIRIEKTAIFPDAAGAGIEIYRKRP
jgi:7,8-dihydroneopterin aldolase/epimerase/oxygenase